jgi:hypothetical protein
MATARGVPSKFSVDSRSSVLCFKNLTLICAMALDNE